MNAMLAKIARLLPRRRPRTTLPPAGDSAYGERRLILHSRRRRSLMRWIFVIICVLAWCVFAEAWFHGLRQTRAAVAERDANLATAVEHYVVRVLRTARAVHLLMGDVLATQDERAVTTLLADRLRVNDIFEELGLCLPDGRVLPEPHPGAVLTAHTCREFVAQTQPGADVATLMPIAHAGHLYVPVTLALIDRSGRQLAVAVGLTPVEKMLGIMGSSRMAEGTVVAIAGYEGRLRAAWRSEGSHVDALSRLADIGSAFGSAGALATIDGDAYLVSRRDLSQDGLRVFVATRESDALASFYARRLRMFLLCAAVTIAIGIASLVLTAMDKEGLRRARALSRARAQLQALNDGLDRQVRERTRQLEQACVDLEAFSYSVAHDVRTPLACIAGFAQALEPVVEATGHERSIRNLRHIKDSAAHMEALTRRLLELAKTAKATLAVREVDLHDIAQEVVAGLRRADPARKVEVRIEPGLRARGDQTLLRQVLENLLGNAWKFTGRQPHAVIALSRHDCGPVPTFVVRDNGVGFDSSASKDLFQPFRRLHDEKQFPGTGLGLATVQRIIGLHGGQVWCRAKPGAGASFFFSVPAARTA